MQQNSVHLLVAPAAMVVLLCLPLLGCGDSGCQSLSGKWSNREGQAFYFKPDGKALWLVRFGSQVDTIAMEYRYDCQKTPVELDLSGFNSGPLEGKTLFGILEWVSDTSFRFDAEAGPGPEVRPATFESEETQKFFQEKE
ncbi:MAG: hypothetical protein EP344_17195 [Bacteroidetes bacterium]|nr:MAG: hypothetical protein EP344_17195 [Bacteroidota bacterium]